MGLKFLSLILLIISGLGEDLTGIRVGLVLTGFFIVMDHTGNGASGKEMKRHKKRAFIRER